MKENTPRTAMEEIADTQTTPTVAATNRLPNGRECLGGMQNNPESVRLFERYGKPHPSLEFRSIMGVMRVHSKECNGRCAKGARISDSCKNLFDRVMRKRFERMDRIAVAEKALSRPLYANLK